MLDQPLANNIADGARKWQNHLFQEANNWWKGCIVNKVLLKAKKRKRVILLNKEGPFLYSEKYFSGHQQLILIGLLSSSSYVINVVVWSVLFLYK